MNRRRIVLCSSVVMVMILFMSLTACQGGKDKSLETVKKNGYIRIAMSVGYPPFSYYNGKGQVAGFDADLAQEIAKSLGVEVKIIVSPWPTIIDRLNSNEFDAILGSMSVTEERSKRVAFSVPYYYARSQVMVLKGSPFKSLKEISAKTVGVIEDSTFESDAKTLGITHIRRFDTNDATLMALKNKQVEAVITDDVVGHYARNTLGLDIEPLGDTVNNDKIAIALRPGDRELLSKIDAIIAQMQKDGTLRQLVEKMAANKYEVPAR